MVRWTAQGTIICVACVLASVLALVTPRLAAAGPQGPFIAIAIAIGLAAAIFAFHKGSRNEFDIEAESSRKAAMPTRTHCTESVRELQRWHPAAWRQASRIRIRPLSFAVLGTDVDEAGRCGWCR